MAVSIGGITGAFGQLQQANALAAQRREQERQRRKAERAGGLSNLGAIAGGGLAAYLSGGNPQAIALGAGGGSTLGRALGGGAPVQAGEAIQIGAGIGGLQQQLAQQQQMEQMGQAESGILGALGPTQQQMALEPGMSGPADVAQQGQAAGLAQMLQSANQAPPGSRLSMLGAALQARQALQPPAPEEFTLGEGDVRYRGREPIAANEKPQSPGNPFGGGERGLALRNILAINEKRRMGVPLSPEEQQADNISRQIASRPSRFTDPQGNVWEMPGLTPPEIYQQGSTSANQATQIPDIPKPRKIMEAPPKDVPAGVRENLRSYDQGIESLNVIEQNIDETGRLRGMASKAGAFLGTNAGAIEFEQARGHIRLAYQASLKGIPSDRDQKLIDDLVPNLTDPPEVVRTKVRMFKETMRRARQGELDYLRQQNFATKELDRAWGKADSSGSGAQNYTRENPATPTTDAEFDALPDGAVYIDPEDKQPYVK